MLHSALKHSERNKEEMSINQQVSAKECDVLANANAKAFPLVIAINMEKNNADASKHSSLEKQQFVQFGDISR